MEENKFHTGSTSMRPTAKHLDILQYKQKQIISVVNSVNTIVLSFSCTQTPCITQLLIKTMSLLYYTHCIANTVCNSKDIKIDKKNVC